METLIKVQLIVYMSLYGEKLTKTIKGIMMKSSIETLIKVQLIVYVSLYGEKRTKTIK